MGKPTVYLDTNIFSSINYRGGGAVAMLRQSKTAEWWGFERKNFDVFTSSKAESELIHGRFKHQLPAIANARRIVYLPLTKEIHRCAHEFMFKGLFPPDEQMDSVHLAVATINRLDYLLSWNQAHLANPVIQLKLERIVRKNGWRAPLLVSPETIPWLSMGQEIRRKDEE